MRLTNFLVRDAIIPNLPVTAAGVDPRDQTAVRAVKEQVIGEMVAALAHGRALPRRRPAGHRRGGAAPRGTRAPPASARHRHPALAAPVGGPADRHARPLPQTACRSTASTASRCTCSSCSSPRRTGPATTSGRSRPSCGRCATRTSSAGCGPARRATRSGRCWRPPRRAGGAIVAGRREWDRGENASRVQESVA